jgi:hypothetical protein
MSSNPMRFAVAGIAAVAVAFGAYAIGNSKNDSSGTANAAQGVPGQAQGRGQFPRSGNGPPGFGAPVTGATADKVSAAALAKYKGTAERVMKLQDGSYMVHVITSSGEYHVAVSKDFKVTGADQGGPGPGGPGSGGPPAGAAPKAPGTAS